MKKRRNPARVRNSVERPRSPGVPLRRQRTALGERDAAAGRRDTERRGVPSDLPKK